MRSKQFGIVVALVLATALAGCGRAASGVDASEGTIEMSVKIDKQRVIPKDRIRHAPKPPVGVVVDGRVYPQGEVPVVEATPEPAAPEAGKGHLRVVVKLAHKIIMAERIRVTVASADQRYYHEFNRHELVGAQVEQTFLDLPPGDYTISTESLNAQDHVVHTDQATGTVAADANSDAEI